MRNITTSLLLAAATIFGAQAQNVGIGTATPISKLHVEQTADADALYIDHQGTARSSILVDHASADDMAFMTNFNDGFGVNVGQLGANALPAFFAFQAGAGLNSRGYEALLLAGNPADGMAVFHEGTGTGLRLNLSEPTNTSRGIDMTHDGTGEGIFINKTNGGGAAAIYMIDNGVSDAIVIDKTNSGWAMANFIADGGGIYNDINGFFPAASNQLRNGGYGALTFMNGNEGWGYYVDSIAGDGYGFFARVNTATPTTGTTVSGAVLAGDQYGLGHGILINHRGAQGRNAEFNIENPANTDYTIFSTHAGQATVLRAENQNAAPTGVIDVLQAEFSGSNAPIDHRAIYGNAAPDINHGIGVYGGGGMYGVYSANDMGAAGTKTFVIDHPLDPSNKMLKHFSIESNEVLNMYRGIVELDANGEAVVDLPEYFEAINIDYSYQLTAIGTPQHPYVLEEIANNQFKVAGAPNTKVSWTVHAQRNDPYMQQYPEKGEDVVIKTGSRAGKYLKPELYNQPASAGMFYNPNEPSHEPTQFSTENEPSAEKFSQQKQEVTTEEDSPVAQPTTKEREVTMKD